MANDVRTQDDDAEAIKKKFGKYPELCDLIIANESLKTAILAAIKDGKIADDGFVPANTKNNPYVATDGYQYNFSQDKLFVDKTLYDGMLAKDTQKTAELVRSLTAAAEEATHPERQIQKFLRDVRRPGDKDGTFEPDPRYGNLFGKSPYLSELAAEALRKNNLSSIYAVPSDKLNGAGASYDYHKGGLSIRLNTSKLDLFEKDGRINGDQEKYTLIFQAGHELGHATRGETLRNADKAFNDSVAAISKGAPPHDFTQPIRDFLTVRRTEEATAHIDGFNAVAAAVKAEKPNATIEDVRNALSQNPNNALLGYRDDFFRDARSGQLRGGMEFDPVTLQIRKTSENIALMSTFYFDQPATESQLGPKKNSDYKNSYAADAIEMLYRGIPAGTEVRINMKSLGLDEAMIESNLSFPDNKARKYVDTSDGEQKSHEFNPGVKVDEKKTASADLVPPQNNSDTASLSSDRPLRYGDNDYLYRQQPDSGMASRLVPDDIPLLRQADSQLALLWDKLGIRDQTERVNLSAALADAASRAGLKSIDQVILSDNGKNLFPMNDSDAAQPYAIRTVLDIEQGRRQPLDQSLASIKSQQTSAAQSVAEIFEPERTRGARVA